MSRKANPWVMTIDRAERLGAFNKKAVARAGKWCSCAVGEALEDYVEKVGNGHQAQNGYKTPHSLKLSVLGDAFVVCVEDNDFDGARNALREVRATVSALPYTNVPNGA